MDNHHATAIATGLRIQVSWLSAVAREKAKGDVAYTMSQYVTHDPFHTLTEGGRCIARAPKGFGPSPGSTGHANGDPGKITVLRDIWLPLHSS